ncbi:glycogen debranching protein [Croceivirga radicis]|uniref:Glycogen debranching protein n=1 Tax=Croceivirga radicis TaxID=1929488 RepID=A0A1V6LNJ2_9FLAO|nr:GH116 family glycosyl hydrolase [Croceivirga radicis]OQD41546.1 glycogen debranching protein [Croceivirga radicis]
MLQNLSASFLLFCLFLSCTNTNKNETVLQQPFDEIGIEGKPEYLNSPFVTAGNRTYLVGHQNGSFPELGWHIKGEMGGLWNHPIKLADGFEIIAKVNGHEQNLNNAERFVNYPFYNEHLFKWTKENLKFKRKQFVPDDIEGLVVILEIENTSLDKQNIELNFNTQSDLRPTWLGERTNMQDGNDVAIYNQDIDGFIIKDDKNAWFLTVNSDLKSTTNSITQNTYSGKGANFSLSYQVPLEPLEKKEVHFFLAGSYTHKKNAITTLDSLETNWKKFFTIKQNRYQKLASQSKLSIPDTSLQKTFEWLKYNCDWLVRTVPEIGSGITAGIPDYPWWFGVDSEYALQGYMAIGQKDAVYNTIKLLDSVSRETNNNGKIIHEMSTNGAVFNPGNINETPQFATLIWRIYQWNGDKEFLIKYFPTVQKGLQWLLEENDLNNNGFPEGFGMMEIHGLDSEMIDVAAYTQQAFTAAAKMAKELNKPELAVLYEQKAQSLKDKINNEFWSDEFNSYADFIGTDMQAQHLIEDAIVRADTLNKPWSVKELQSLSEYIKDHPSKKARPFVLHHNWVVNTPMEVGLADSTKALKALETAKKYRNPFGMFVTGIDRDNSAGANENNFVPPKLFSYTGAVMTLPTGVQAIAENNYGRADNALDYLKRMTRTFSYALPGSMYEVSPDYGMIVQAWNIYSFAYPIVHQFFGVKPQAQNKQVLIQPQMPSAWNNASLEQIVMGDGANEVSVYYEKKDNQVTVRVTQTNPEWEIVLFPSNKMETIDKMSKHSKWDKTKKRLTSNEKEVCLTYTEKQL